MRVPREGRVISELTWSQRVRVKNPANRNANVCAQSRTKVSRTVSTFSHKKLTRRRIVSLNVLTVFSTAKNVVFFHIRIKKYSSNLFFVEKKNRRLRFTDGDKPKKKKKNYGLVLLTTDHRPQSWQLTDHNYSHYGVTIKKKQRSGAYIPRRRHSVQNITRLLIHAVMTPTRLWYNTII